MERFFWRAFNALARVFGILLVLGGLIVILESEGLFPSTVSPSGAAPETAPKMGWLLGVVLIAFGTAFLLVRSFRPDLGDQERLISPHEARGNRTTSRTWWTGRPK